MGGVVERDERRFAERVHEGQVSSRFLVEATDLPPEPTRPTISLHNLQSHHCRWPIGDPGSPDFGFCGDAIRDESVPYCTGHCRIAYVPINKRSVAQLEAYANA
jgi:hypothetical protein